MPKPTQSSLRLSTWAESEQGFTAAEKALLAMLALGLILMVSKIILQGSDRAASLAQTMLSQQNTSEGGLAQKDINSLGSGGRAGEHDDEGGNTDPMGPGYYAAGEKTREIGFFLRHPIKALQIGEVKSGSTNISTNAVRFATNDLGLKETDSHEGSEVNAFRHTLWQAEITERFGSQIAHEVGNAHEDDPFAISGERHNDTVFDSESQADQAVDLHNNEIGRRIGESKPGAKMNELAHSVLEEFHNQGLWVSEQGPDGKWHITQRKLPDEAYQTAKNRLAALNENGFDDKQEADRDKKGRN